MEILTAAAVLLLCVEHLLLLVRLSRVEAALDRPVEPVGAEAPEEGAKKADKPEHGSVDEGIENILTYRAGMTKESGSELT